MNISLLTDNQKIVFIEENYPHAFDQDNLDESSSNLINGILPNGGRIENVSLTSEMETLREKYSTFNNLPGELTKIIALTSSYDDVISMCGTEKRLEKICEDEYFWMEWIENNFQGVNISYVDHNAKELQYVASTLLEDPVYSTLMSLRYEYYEAFALLFFLHKTVRTIRTNKYVVDFINTTNENSSQDRKDLALIFATENAIPVSRAIRVELEYYAKAIELLSIGANSQREYGYSLMTGRGKIALETLLSRSKHFKDNVETERIYENFQELQITDFNISRRSLITLFESFQRFSDDERNWFDLENILKEIEKIKLLQSDDIIKYENFYTGLLREFLIRGGSIVGEDPSTFDYDYPDNITSLINEFPNQVVKAPFFMLKSYTKDSTDIFNPGLISQIFSE